MNLLKSTFLFIALLNLVGQVQSQAPVIRQFTVEDGLPGLLIYSTIQDSKGFIWSGTDRGITRFDGHQFKTFNSKNGLPSNEVWRLQEDAKGRLWLDTYNGIVYIENEKVVIIDDPLLPLVKGKVEHVFRDNDHYLSISTQNNYFLFHYKEQQEFVSLTDSLKNKYKVSDEIIGTENQTPPLSVKKLKEDLDLSSDQALLTISKGHTIDKNNTIARLILGKKNTIQDFELISPGRVLCIFNGEIWSLEDGKIELIELNHLTENQDAPYALSINRLSSNTFWIKTRERNFIVDSLLHNLPDYNYLAKIKINDIYIDQQKNLWLSTNRGLSLISNKVQTSQSYFLDSKQKSSSIRFLAMNEQEDIYCLNADGFLFKLDKKEGLKSFSDFPIDLAPSILSFDFHNNLWIGGSYLFRISKEHLQNHSEEFKKQRPQPILTRCTKAIKNIKFVDKETYLTTSYNCFAEYKHNQKESTKHIPGRHYGIGLMPENQILVTGKFGSKKLRRTKDAIEVIAIPDSSYHPILNMPTDFTAIDKEGLPWLAVNNIGLYRWQEDQIDSIQELSGVLIQSLYVDKKGNLWACTTVGLIKIYNIQSNPFSYDYRWYTTKDGLISNDVNTVLTLNDQIFVGTEKGLTILEENRRPAESIGPFHFSSFHVNGKKQPLQDQYDLKYSENNILIEYECLDYQSIGNISFQYKLVGIDDKWINTPNLQKEYTSLSAGNYTFLLRKQIRKEAENKFEPLKISFNISPPFWKSGWFIASSFLCLAAIGFALYKRQIKKIEEEAHQKTEVNKRLAQLELNALQSQMNPHFVFNAMNAIQDFIFKNEARVANRYLVKFSRLMRLYLESSKEKSILLSDEIQLLQLYIDLEQLRFEDKFISKITVEDNVFPAMINIPSMLLQPFVENAINHGLIRLSNQGVLLLHFKKEENILHCRIDDNGIGIDKSKEINRNTQNKHKSRGLQLVKERQRVWNIIGDNSVRIEIKDLSNPNQGITGTRVDIYITMFQ